VTKLIQIMRFIAIQGRVWNVPGATFWHQVLKPSIAALAMEDVSAKQRLGSAVQVKWLLTNNAGLAGKCRTLESDL
jgi:hypothetical protein